MDGKSSESAFDVPCGLLVQKSRLLVADYNNSSIRIADISSLVSQKKSSQTDAEDLGDSDRDHDQASDSVGSCGNSAIDTSCPVRRVRVSSLKLIADGINGVSLLPQPLFLSESLNSNVVVVDNKLSSVFLLHTWRTMPAHAKHEKQLYQQQAMCRLLAHFPGSNLQGICFMKSNLMLCVADQREEAVHCICAESGKKLRQISNVPSPCGVCPSPIKDDRILVVSKLQACVMQFQVTVDEDSNLETIFCGKPTEAFSG